MKRNFLLAALLLALSPAVLHAQSQKNKQMPMPGSDRDKHGCIPSAGYTWSEIKNDCIRVFEQDIKLKELHPGKTVYQVAVILSTDKKKAEVFLPGTKGGTILKYKERTKSWVKDKIELTNTNGYALSINGKKMYAQK